MYFLNDPLILPIAIGYNFTKVIKNMFRKTHHYFMGKYELQRKCKRMQKTNFWNTIDAKMTF